METTFPVVPSYSQSEKPTTSTHVRGLFQGRVRSYDSYPSIVPLRVLSDESGTKRRSYLILTLE